MRNNVTYNEHSIDATPFLRYEEDQVFSGNYGCCSGADCGGACDGGGFLPGDDIAK